MIGYLLGCSVGFNVLGKILYGLYGCSQAKGETAKKNSDNIGLFKTTIMHLITLSLLYIYMGLAIYYSFDNAKFIPATSKLAGAYIAGLVLDILVIDTTIGMYAASFAKP